MMSASVRAIHSHPTSDPTSVESNEFACLVKADLHKSFWFISCTYGRYCGGPYGSYGSLWRIDKAISGYILIGDWRISMRDIDRLLAVPMVQAVFLGIHGAMVRVDWTTWGFAYYAAELQKITRHALWYIEIAKLGRYWAFEVWIFPLVN